jgi:hypothetical protein
VADFSKLKKLAENAPLEQAAKLAKKEKGLLEKGMDLLAAPQKYASKKLAEAAGLKAGDTSEENFAAIADAGGDALGIPRDSTAGNLVKAGLVAGAEVFADPLSLIPIGKVAKGIKGLGKLGPMAAIAKVAEEGGALKKAAQISEATKLQKAQALQNIADRIKLAKTETEKAWLAAQPKPKLRPELQGKDTAQIWGDVKATTEAVQKAAIEAKPAKGKAAQYRDMQLASDALDKAAELGVPESRQQAFVRLYLKNRGGGK